MPLTEQWGHTDTAAHAKVLRPSQSSPPCVAFCFLPLVDGAGVPGVIWNLLWSSVADTLQKAGTAEADVRVERSLYQRAVGYSYDAVKIYCDKNGR